MMASGPSSTTAASLPSALSSPQRQLLTAAFDGWMHEMRDHMDTVWTPMAVWGMPLEDVTTFLDANPTAESVAALARHVFADPARRYTATAHAMDSLAKTEDEELAELTEAMAPFHKMAQQADAEHRRAHGGVPLLNEEPVATPQGPRYLVAHEAYTQRLRLLRAFHKAVVALNDEVEAAAARAGVPHARPRVRPPIA
jgi:hypothetical protein